jgi:hypothetical protein
LIADWQPELVAAVRSLELTAPTCGLPFVVPTERFSTERCDVYTTALNQALEQLPSAQKNRLHLSAFEGVRFDDYASVIELEKFAIDAGYPELN